MIDPDRPYSRLAIDIQFAKIKASMQKAALVRGGDGRALYIDVYTGKTLRGGDPYDYEHIRSSEELFTKYKGFLTDEQIAQVVNCPENVAVTLRTINQSKGKKRMEVWMNHSENIINNGVDLKLAFHNLKKADLGILQMVESFTK